MYTYRIWDKTSPINGCPAETALQSLRLKPTDQLCILSQDGQDCITQIFPSITSEADIKAWVDKYNADVLAQQQAAQAAANQPSETDILGQQVAALTLSSAQKDTLIQQLGAQMVQAQLDIATLKGGAV